MTKRSAFAAALLGLVMVVSQTAFNADAPSLDVNHAATNQSRMTSSALRKKLFGIRWITYAPTNFDPTTSPPVLPSDDSVRKDLAVLRRAGFDGLVTYGMDITSLPHLAKETGFRGLLLGVWNPNSSEELERAKQSANSPLVVGIIVGNEGLTFHRYDMESLRRAINDVKRATGLPVSTTEVVETYTTNRELVEISDFLMPNAHPFFHGTKMRDPRKAVEWTRKAYESLIEYTQGKPLLFKEVGLPTAGDEGLGEEAQALYYTLLMKTEVRFVYFEAFDCLFKKESAIEPHWGLFHADRSPKPVVKRLRPGLPTLTRKLKQSASG
jgi:exo-beta-1,3-glucanase (GH17 family)